jgi:hypothetical protein
MSKIQHNLPQTNHLLQQQSEGPQKNKGRATTADDKGKTTEKTPSRTSNTYEDLPGIGLYSSANTDQSSGGFDTSQESTGVLEVVEERQRRLQEDGIGSKLLGGRESTNTRVDTRALRRNVGAEAAQSAMSNSATRETSTASPVQNVREINQRTSTRQIASSSLLQNSNNLISNQQEVSAIGQRKNQVFDDDLPRVGLNAEKK